MIFGINNRIIIMEVDCKLDFKFNMQPYQQQYQESNQLIDFNIQKQGYHLKKCFKILQKYYYRIFMGRFKSTVYQILIQNIVQQKQVEVNPKNEVDWPYRSLLMKPNKTEHEMIEIQFINMCAEKIQSVFKGYLTRKRYIIASKRLKRFTELFKALIKGWKVKSILRCEKIKEQLKSIKIKRKQVERQQASSRLSSKPNTKKIDYLKYSLQNQTNYFHRHFAELYHEGGWIYEPREPIVIKRIQKWSDKKKIEPMKENNFIQPQIPNETEHINSIKPDERQIPEKKKRTREMRDNARKGRNKEIEVSKIEQNIEIQSKNQAYSQQLSTNGTSFGEDRPIQAKGAYTYNQMENTNMISKKAQDQSNNNQNEMENDKKAQVKKIQKKKLEKRQKYDPRKAIEEQKKKKKQQQIKSEAEIKSQSQLPSKSKPSEIKQQDKKVTQNVQQKKLKTDKQQNNRSTVNYPKNKGKIQPRIDCWGNRKTVIKKNPQDFIKGTKIIMNPDQDYNNDTNMELITSQKLAAKIQERRQRQKQRLQYSQQREKARIQIQKNCQQSQRIKEYFQRRKEASPRPQSEAVKFLKAQAMKERQKALEQQRQKRKDTIYRSVQQLAQTYKNQYITRYQSKYKFTPDLLPKLNLLAAARNTEKNNLIPVISPESDFVERIIEQNKLNKKFWSTVSKIERTFKQFIKG